MKTFVIDLKQTLFSALVEWLITWGGGAGRDWKVGKRNVGEGGKHSSLGT